MMRIAVFLVFAAACGGRQVAPPAAVGQDRAPTPEEVVVAAKGAAEQYRQAWEVRSFDALAPLYVHNLDVVVAHQGRAQQGWTSVEGYLKGLLAGAAEVHIKLEDVTVTALGPEGAAVSATMQREINDGTSAVIERGSLTLALRREADGWRIVQEHFSYPPR